MASIFDMVQQQLGTGGLARLGQQLGASPQQTRTAVAAALPMVMGSLAQRAADPAGAHALHQRLDPESEPSGDLLSSLLGNHQPHVEQAVGDASALDPAKATKVLAFLGPIVIGSLMRKRQQDGLGPDQLNAELSQSRKEAEQHATEHSPELGGMLGGLLQKIVPVH